MSERAPAGADSTAPGNPGRVNPVPAEMRETARAIAAAQLACGAIPWPDGHVDPWDHVECAMALSACGLTRQARLAYQWLRETQRADGAWPRSSGAAPPPPTTPTAAHASHQAHADQSAEPDHPSAPTHISHTSPRTLPPPHPSATPLSMAPHGLVATDEAAESHHAAYVAVGVWHELLVTGDLGFAMSMWPVVRRAVDWVVELQTPRGEIAWERDATGAPGEFALLSGCASILQGLRCAIALAEIAGHHQPDWELAAHQLAHVVACHPEAFADKSRWAMDWYYPVLGGALRGAAAARHLAAGWDTFVVPGLGVRCVSDQPWVTVAETCELVLSLEACGKRAEALDLLQSVQWQRHRDGSYWTGWQFANGNHFPNEQSSWTAAAVILATDALHRFSRGAGIFRDVPVASAVANATMPAGTGDAGGARQAQPFTARALGMRSPTAPISPMTNGSPPSRTPRPTRRPAAALPRPPAVPGNTAVQASYLVGPVQ